jgi:type I restriction enzyme M protein
MTRADLLADSKTHTLDLFPPGTVANVEKRLADKDGKPTILCLVRNKLYDELACYRGTHTHLRFRNSNTAAQLKSAIQSLFEDACGEWPGVFPVGEKIRLTPDHLAVCIGSLEEWKLFNSNLDVVDDAFEYLVNQSSKGEKGQYFTPRWVIDLCVKMLNPREQETLIGSVSTESFRRAA